MNQSRAYGNIRVYCPDGNLMFRANEDKLRFYKKNDLVEEIENGTAYKLKFQPAGLGHTDRNQELLEPRENKCVCCGSDEIEQLTRHHIVPSRYRKHFPMHMKSNNHRYVVFVCWECHSDYNYFEYQEDNRIAEVLGLTAEKRHSETARVNRRILSGIADTIMFKSDSIPATRMEELRQSFVERSGLELNEENLVKVRKLRYDQTDEEGEYFKLVVDRMKNLYEFQQSWLEHFNASMEPDHLPKDLAILLA